MSDRYEQLKKKVLAFRDARDWAPYHSPKNLAEGLCVEAAELLEHFLWIDAESSRRLTDEQKQAAGTELADVFVFLIYLSEELGIDLFDATLRKLEDNARKYPVDKARGSHKKYTDL